MSDFHLGNLDSFLSYPRVKHKIEVAVQIFGLIGEVGLHGVAAAQTIGYGVVVALHLFALEGIRLSLLLGGGCPQFGRDGDNSFPLHVFLGESSADGDGYLSASRLQ